MLSLHSFPFNLLAQLTTAASSASAPASAPAATPFWATDEFIDAAFFGVALAWLGVALAVLIQIRFFSRKPLLTEGAGGKAPARTAVALMPLAFGTVILYILGVLVAVAVGQITGFADLMPPAPPPPTLTNAPAPATQNTSARAPESAPAAASTTAPGLATAPTSTAAAEPDPATAPDETDDPAKALRVQILDMSAELSAIAVAVFVCRRLFARGLTGMGLHPRFLLKGLLIGLLGFFLFQPFNLVLNFIVSTIYDFFQHAVTVHETIQKILDSPSIGTRLGFALIAGVAAPVAEEIFFRGIVQSALIQEQWGFNFFFARRLPQGFPITPDPSSGNQQSPDGSLNYATPEPAPASIKEVVPRWLAILGAMIAFLVASYWLPPQLIMPCVLLLCGGLVLIYQYIGPRSYALTPGRRWFAILVTALFFVSVHPFDHAPLIGFLAIALGYVYERTGNLYACMVIHACFNWCSLWPLLYR